MDPERGPLYERFLEAPEWLFDRFRCFSPNNDWTGSPIEWTVAVDQYLNTNRIKTVSFLWQSLCSAAVEFEICQVRVCRKASDGDFRSNHAGLLAFLLQEAAMDIMDSLRPPTERTIDTPRCNLIDLSSHVQETKQDDTSGPKFRTGGCGPDSDNLSTDLLDTDPSAPCVSDGSTVSLYSQGQSLEHRMEGILADWKGVKKMASLTATQTTSLTATLEGPLSAMRASTQRLVLVEGHASLAMVMRHLLELQIRQR
jgi:hypothetical protein